jgi:hypothetical protein
MPEQAWVKIGNGGSISFRRGESGSVEDGMLAASRTVSAHRCATFGSPRIAAVSATCGMQTDDLGRIMQRGLFDPRAEQAEDLLKVPAPTAALPFEIPAPCASIRLAMNPIVVAPQNLDVRELD